MKLLKSKTKLSPLKSVTIPRLELCGALLLAQLLSSLNRLKQTLNITTVYCFTDSMVVLAWLKTPTYLLQTFVGNRVQQILDVTKLDSWHHVRGAENPADIGSRGVLPADLFNCHLWWSGPDWCSNSIDQWPTSTDTSAVDIPELKPTMLSLVAVQTSSLFIAYTERHSSFLRLVRVIAYVKRFLFNCKIPKQNKLCRRIGPLSASEFTRAKLHCVSIIQHTYYPQAFTTINPDQLPLELKRLAVFVDQEGILRVGGRLHNAPLPTSQKHPILLPSRSHFTSLVVDFYHRLNHHIGPNALSASIRQEYWIPSARNLLKLIKRQCVICIRFSKQILSPLMGNLPASRFHAVRPFLHTGVDFGGPFLCRTSNLRKAPTIKTYMCLYVCLSTRAVHIELALGLSVEDFLDTFDRFVARRGIPAAMYSDNGTNFVGASGYLRDVFEWFNKTHTQDSLVNHTAHLSITWKFNPPHSPHMGGAWEAGIKSAKALIHKSFGDRSYTTWELATMFTKVEGILNSRPLQPVSDCPDDLDALTPGHFIIGQPLNALPEVDFSDVPKSRLNAWELVRERVQFFWTRWQEEYVRSLQSRDKWVNNPPNLKVGNLVLVSDLQTPPSRWAMARVLQTHPGTDDVVRVVTLKTSKGVFKRPTVKLVPLFI